MAHGIGEVLNYDTSSMPHFHHSLIVLQVSSGQMLKTTPVPGFAHNTPASTTTDPTVG